MALCEESCRALIDLKNGERGQFKSWCKSDNWNLFNASTISFICSKLSSNRFKSAGKFYRIIAKNILNREIDIAVVGGEIPIELKKNLSIEDFVEDEFSLIISKLHPFATKKKIN